MNYLYIRTDMNKIIATGHVMRCLAIADEAALMGIIPVFILADTEAVDIISSRGYEYIVLDSVWNQMEGELNALESVIRKRKITDLLIDSYMVTEPYLRKLSELVSVTYIDDLAAFHYPVDRIICYGICYEQFCHEQKYQNVELLLGSSYAPLRQEFKSLPQKEISDNIENVLIMTGGSDPYNLLEGMIDSLLLICDKKEACLTSINAICGKYNSNYDKLSDKYKEDRRINLIKHTDRLIDYMKAADIAISAGGSTTYELCAVGTPAIVYSLADNQLNNVRKFDDDGLMFYAGDVRYDDVPAKAELCIERLIDKESRAVISAGMRELVDGRGAERIVKSIKGL